MFSVGTQRVVTLHTKLYKNHTCWRRQYTALFAELDEWKRTEPNIHEDALYVIRLVYGIYDLNKQLYISEYDET